MDRTAFWLFTAEVFGVSGILLYLYFIHGSSLTTIWNSWGIPLLIYTVVILTYPFYLVVKRLQRPN